MNLIQEVYVSQAQSCFSIDDHLKSLVEDVCHGGWVCLVISTLRAAFTPSVSLHANLRAAGGPKALSLLWNFTLRLLTEHLLREFPVANGYPNYAAVVLDPAQGPVCGRALLVADWKAVIKLEHLCHQHPELTSLHDDILFARLPIVHLLWEIARAEECRRRTSQTVSCARAMVARLGDEKAPEDFHNTVRDTQREQRHGRVSPATVFHCCQNSGVLDKRFASVVTVSLDNIARQNWKTFHEKSRLPSRSRKPSEWPDFMNKILLPKTWPSLTVPALFSATMSLQALREASKRDLFDRPALLVRSWWSRLCTEHSLLWDVASRSWSMVLNVAKFGVLVINMIEEEAGERPLLRFNFDTEAVSSLFIRGPDHCMVVPCEPEWQSDSSVMLRAAPDHERILLIQSAMLRRYMWTSLELTRALAELNTSDDFPTTLAEQRQRLIEFSFPDNPEKAVEVAELYAQPVVVPDDDGMDPELEDLLTDLVEQDDGGNASDLKTYRSDLGRKTCQRLLNQRRKNKVDRVAAKTKRKAAARAKASARQKLQKKVRRVKPATRDDDPVPPAEPPSSPVPRPPPSSAAAPQPGSAAPPPPPPPDAGPTLRGDYNKLRRGQYGWLHWSRVKQQTNANCAGHPGDPPGFVCKMDRSCARGAATLCELWLVRGQACGSSEGHALLKEELSCDSAFRARSLLRAEMEAEAAAGNAALQDFLDCESEGRGGDRIIKQSHDQTIE